MRQTINKYVICYFSHRFEVGNKSDDSNLKILQYKSGKDHTVHVIFAAVGFD